MATADLVAEALPEMRPGSLARARVVQAGTLLTAPIVLLALGVWGLARGGAYGNDEAATRWAALLPLHSLFHLLGHIDAVHGLYYLGMHAWAMFGNGPVALRLPSLLAAAATAGVITAISRSLKAPPPVGVIAGLLFAISPFVMFYAQTARSYALVSLLVAITTLVLVRAVDAERSRAMRSVLLRRWLAYAGLIGLAGWLNEMALLAVAAHGVTALVTSAGWRSRMHWLTAALLGVVSVLPLFAISYRERQAISEITPATARDARLLLGAYFGPSTAVMIVTIGCTVVALLPRARSGVARLEPVAPGLVSVALPLLLVPPTLLLGESVIGKPMFAARYLLYSSIGAVLLVAEGACRLGRKLPTREDVGWAWLPGIAVLVVALVAQLPAEQRVRTADARMRNYGAPAAFLEHNARAGDGVLFFSSFFRMIELGYPEDFHDLQDVALARSPLSSGTFRGVNAPLSVAGPRILACDRIWVVGARPRDPLAGPIYGGERNLLFRYYMRRELRRFKGVTVTLWTRRSDSRAAA